jgi:hypothetical protein
MEQSNTICIDASGAAKDSAMASIVLTAQLAAQLAHQLCTASGGHR